MNDELKDAQVGAKVWFAEEERPYRIRARNKRYLVCTKPFNLFHTVLYTIVDLEERCRGTENLVFGCGFVTDEECAEAIKRLEGDPSVIDFATQVSRRNRVPLVVLRISSEEILG